MIFLTPQNVAADDHVKLKKTPNVEYNVSKTLTVADKTIRIKYELQIADWVVDTGIFNLHIFNPITLYSQIQSNDVSCTDTPSWTHRNTRLIWQHIVYRPESDIIIFDESIEVVLDYALARQSPWTDEQTYHTKTGKYLCIKMQLTVEAAISNPFWYGGNKYINASKYSSTHKFIIKIWDNNALGKAIAKIEAFFAHPFTGTNLYWTVGYTISAIVLIIMVKFKRKGNKSSLTWPKF